MRIIFSSHAWNDYLYWNEHEPKTVRRIHRMFKEIMRTPFDGVGKPECLKHALSGYWSRRITSEHRLVYKVVGDDVLIVQLRYYY